MRKKRQSVKPGSEAWNAGTWVPGRKQLPFKQTDYESLSVLSTNSQSVVDYNEVFAAIMARRDGAVQGSGKRSQSKKTHKQKIDETVVDLAQKLMGGHSALHVEDAVRAMQKAGVAPDCFDIQALEADANSQVDAIRLAQTIQRIKNKADTPNELVKIFEFYDPEQRGSLRYDTFRNVLCSLGDSLNAQDVDEVAERLAAKSERIDYVAFAEALLNNTLIPELDSSERLAENANSAAEPAVGSVAEVSAPVSEDLAVNSTADATAGAF